MKRAHTWPLAMAFGIHGRLGRSWPLVCTHCPLVLIPEPFLNGEGGPPCLGYNRTATEGHCYLDGSRLRCNRIIPSFLFPLDPSPGPSGLLGPSGGPLGPSGGPLGPSGLTHPTNRDVKKVSEGAKASSETLLKLF